MQSHSVSGSANRSHLHAASEGHTHAFATALVLAGVSALMLAAALLFQYLGGLSPCPLCLWQRWPHALAVSVGGLLIVGGLSAPANRPRLALAALGALALFALIGAGIAGFHAGVEQHWWAGLSSCSGASLTATDPRSLVTALLAQPAVRCDEIPWSFLGLSMAAWNGLVSLGIAALALRSVGRALWPRRQR